MMKDIKKLYIYILIFATIAPIKSIALVEFEDAIFPELISSGRALGMGNAYLSKSDDSAAVFYNPSGIGSVRSPHLHLSNFHIEANSGWKSSSTGGKLTDAISGFSDGLGLNGTRENLLENRGELSHLKLQAMPNFTARFISVGYLYSQQLRATIGKEDNALFEYATRRDHGPYAALTLATFGGIFKIGASVVWLNRREAIGEADRNTTIELEDSDYLKGSAMIITSGVKLTLPFQMLPTFSAVLHNSGSAEFSGAGGAGTPEKIKSSLDIGFSLTPKIGKITRFHIEIDYKDLQKKFADVSSERKLLFGMEMSIARTLFIRIGYGDGYGSAGLGVKSQKVQFDLTTYAVDTTSSEYRGKEDRRFALTISSGF